jgi:hypothetical protein
MSETVESIIADLRQNASVRRQGTENLLAHRLADQEELIADRLSAALPPAPPQAQEPDDDEPFHTGDDDRLDFMTSIRAGIEELQSDEDFPPNNQQEETLSSLLEDCDKLDALIIETIRRERRPTPPAPEQAQPIEELRQQIEVLNELLELLWEMREKREGSTNAFYLMADRAFALADRLASPSKGSTP